MFLNHSNFKLKKTPVLLAFLIIICYFFFAYHLIRTDYFKLIGLYSCLFILFLALVTYQKHNIKFLTFISFLFRTVFLFSIPNLSQDFYRFIWDGRMLLEGWNPYLSTPEFFISKGEFPIAQAKELYEGMGTLNGSHYTNYPPLNQLCFVLANLIPGNGILSSVTGMRLLIIAADFGTLHYGKRLLGKLKLPIHNIFLYILNPFIIIELTGNLHFEGVMIFFLVWSLCLLHSGKWRSAAVVFACSVSIKLIPLMFLPLFYKWFVKSEKPIALPYGDNDKGPIKESETKQSYSLKQIPSSIRIAIRALRNEKRIHAKAGMTKLIGFFAIIAIITILLFAPYYSSQFINNYTRTIGLWFQNFEFNASLYYVARDIGYLFRGYNEIATIGKYIPFVVILFVLIITLFRNNKSLPQLITSMLFVLSFYFFTATTVHPWYIATLLILSIFTNYKFPMVWSFVIILSYLAYANIINTENLLIIGLEYLVVYGVLIWELLFKNMSIKKAT